MLTLVTILVGMLAGFAGARVLRRPKPTRAPDVRRELDLSHLQRAALAEMLRHVRPERGAAVPAEFRVRIHPEDKATVDQAPGLFRQGLEQAVAKAGAEHGWKVPAHIRIDLDADSTRPRGAPAVDARTAAAAPMAAPPAAPAAAAPAAPPAPPTRPARLEQAGGPAHVLGAVTSIGRAPECDVQVDDTRVSRRHVSIRFVGPHWTVTDEGSSNGTRRNGTRLAPTTPVSLNDGDEVGVGPVTFTFRSGVVQDRP